MCGIAAMFCKEPTDPRYIKRMCDTIKHRGPDGSGYLSINSSTGIFHSLIDSESVIEGIPLDQFNEEANIYLGHRRLSIIDLSANGHQPMTYLNRYQIVFNGEIYNYIELREELVKEGYQFHSQTDTEVILASYDFWGEECLNHFNGMWSFVIYDTENQNIFLSRDRFGIKPLFYFMNEKYFVLASEIKSILALPFLDASPNLDYCQDFLANGAREFTKETAFKNIYRFPSASKLSGKLDDFLGKQIKPVHYWTLKPNLSNEPFDANRLEDYRNQLFELLQSSVQLRLRADVKVGSALSGGLDSSSLVYLINSTLKNTVGNSDSQLTFSCVYPSKETIDCDESDFIKTLVDDLNIEGKFIEPNVKDIPREHRRMIYHMDTPPTATMMSSWHTFILVNSHGVKVNLDGQGADEIAAGYLRYFVNYLGDSKSPKLQAEKLKTIPGSTPFIKQGLRVNKAKKLGATLLIKLLGKEYKGFLHLNTRLAIDTTTILENLLHWSDRTSMAFGVESRVPFLDYRIVEFMASVPACYKIHDTWTKFIIRSAMDEKLPDSIVWRKDKMGWPIPEEYWFKGELKDFAFENIKNSQFLISNNYIDESFSKDDLLKLPVGKLVRLLNLAVWSDLFIEGRKSEFENVA